MVSNQKDRSLVYSTDRPYSEQISKKSTSPSSKHQKHAKKSSAPAASLTKDGVRIQRETAKRGGKTVTVIYGLQHITKDHKKLTKNLKSQLGTGGTLKDMCIEIQGDHRDKILTILEKEGIKAKLAGG